LIFVNTKIASKIKRLREANNFTQEYVADAIGIAPNTYSLLERGTSSIRLDRLEKIAKFYGVDVFEFLNDSKASSLSSLHIVKDELMLDVRCADCLNSGPIEEVLGKIYEQNQLILSAIRQLINDAGQRH